MGRISSILGYGKKLTLDMMKENVDLLHPHYLGQWRIYEEKEVMGRSPRRSRKIFRFFRAKPDEKTSLHYLGWPQKIILT